MITPGFLGTSVIRILRVCRASGFGVRVSGWFAFFGGWGRGRRIREGLSNRFLALVPRVVFKPVPDKILEVNGVLSGRVGTVGLGLLGLLAGKVVRSVRDLEHRVAEDM